MQVVAIKARNSGFIGIGEKINGSQKVADEPGVVPFEVAHVERGIKWPEVICDIKNLP
jgi:hypothetical protein